MLISPTMNVIENEVIIREQENKSKYNYYYPHNKLKKINREERRKKERKDKKFLENYEKKRGKHCEKIN